MLEGSGTAGQGGQVSLSSPQNFDEALLMKWGDVKGTQLVVRSDTSLCVQPVGTPAVGALITDSEKCDFTDHRQLWYIAGFNLVHSVSGLCAQVVDSDSIELGLCNPTGYDQNGNYQGDEFQKFFSAVDDTYGFISGQGDLGSRIFNPEKNACLAAPSAFVQGAVLKATECLSLIHI